MMAMQVFLDAPQAMREVICIVDEQAPGFDSQWAKAAFRVLSQEVFISLEVSHQRSSRIIAAGSRLVHPLRAQTGHRLPLQRLGARSPQAGGIDRVDGNARAVGVADYRTEPFLN